MNTSISQSILDKDLLINEFTNAESNKCWNLISSHQDAETDKRTSRWIERTETNAWRGFARSRRKWANLFLVCTGVEREKTIVIGRCLWWSMFQKRWRFSSLSQAIVLIGIQNRTSRPARCCSDIPIDQPYLSTHELRLAENDRCDLPAWM